MSISTPGSVVERASKEFSRRMHSLGFKSAQHSSRYGIIFGLWSFVLDFVISAKYGSTGIFFFFFGFCFIVYRFDTKLILNCIQLCKYR